MTFAVLPAAGKSTRMGRPKLSLPLGERTILEHVVSALREAEIEHILVVIGPHVSELTALAQHAGAEVCQLPEETADMRATVEHGLRWLEERFQPRAEDGWFLVPADHPALVPSTVRQLQQARSVECGGSIFVPTWQGRRGHPVLFSWRHVEGIRQHTTGEGLNTYVRSHAMQTIEVPVADPNILIDLDTPEDYERVLREFG